MFQIYLNLECDFIIKYLFLKKYLTFKNSFLIEEKISI